MEFDWLVSNFIHFDLSCPFLDVLMPVVTYTCEFGALFLALAVILHLTRRHRRDGVIMLISIGLAFLISYLIINNIVERPRPYQLNEIALLIPEPSGYSMPSSHVSNAFAGAVSLSLIKRQWGYIAVPYACLVAFSRLYLYVHFFSDVLVGAGIGIGSAFLVKYLFERNGWLKRLQVV